MHWEKLSLPWVDRWRIWPDVDIRKLKSFVSDFKRQMIIINVRNKIRFELLKFALTIYEESSFYFISYPLGYVTFMDLFFPYFLVLVCFSLSKFSFYRYLFLDFPIYIPFLAILFGLILTRWPYKFNCFFLMFFNFHKWFHFHFIYFCFIYFCSTQFLLAYYYILVLFCLRSSIFCWCICPLYRFRVYVTFVC